MKRHPALAFAAALVGALAACSSPQPPAAASFSDAFYSPADPPPSRYIIDAKIDVASGAVEGRETVGLKNTGRAPLTWIAFDWGVGAWSTLEVSVGGRKIFPLDEAVSAPRTKPVKMALPEPLAPGASVDLAVSFSQKAGDSRKRSVYQTSSLGPRLWWDGAHNRDGFAALTAAWDADLGFAPPEAIVLALAQDKDVEAIAAALAPWACPVRLVATQSRNPRALPAATLAARLAAAGLPAETVPRVDAALAAALGGASAGRVLLCGSLFAVAEAMAEFGGAPGEWL